MMELSDFKDKELSFGSGGWVRYIDHCGSDSSITRAARISYGLGTHTLREDTELIRYLVRNWHSSPLEICNITLHIRLPLYVMAQLARHRTFRLNQYSQRYSVAIDETETTTADAWRGQSNSNKQASNGFIPEVWTSELEKAFDSDKYALKFFRTPGQYLTAREKELNELAREVYEERIAFGVAREQARKCLPVSTYTEIYLNADLRNLLHYLHLRRDAHADPPHQEMAGQINEIVKAWCPIAWEAHEDYVVKALSLSAGELTAIAAFEGDSFGLLGELLRMNPTERAELLEASGLTSKSERMDFTAKLRRLAGDSC